jgi:hypothetical protein
LVSQKLFCIIVMSGAFERARKERIVYKVAKRLSRCART